MSGQLHTKECPHCKGVFDYQYHHATQELYCPFCFFVIESVSDYGFGPVWPAYFFVGNKEIAVINQFGKYPDFRYELDIYDRSRMNLKTDGKNNFLDVMAVGSPIVQDFVAENKF